MRQATCSTLLKVFMTVNRPSLLESDQKCSFAFEGHVYEWKVMIMIRLSSGKCVF